VETRGWKNWTELQPSWTMIALFHLQHDTPTTPPKVCDTAPYSGARHGTAPDAVPYGAARR